MPNAVTFKCAVDFLLAQIFLWSTRLQQKYVSQTYDRRLDIDSREYVKEWERLADTSRATFECINAVDRDGVITSLWSGRLPDKRELLILSIDRRPNAPQYDRGFADRSEALAFFSRFQPGGEA